ncbi:CorA family divalent cation transporter [Streptomyces sp. NPDC058459]|uniref:CorA family divalent cation transporter n=1 Tax=Streptomyces sp. NPDC058459 TaxID=3346508 RepID=UPI003648F798
MIVTTASAPEAAYAPLEPAELSSRLKTARFLLADIDLSSGNTSGGMSDSTEDAESLACLLGLEVEGLDWFGRARESVRAEFIGELLGLVVPVVHGERIAHVHVLATDRYLVTAHRAPALTGDHIIGHLRRERPRDSVASLFLMLQEALGTFRRAAVAALLEVEKLEDDMFEERRPEQIYRLAQLRRRSALLHQSLLPWVQAVDETITRRLMARYFPRDRQRLAREFQQASRTVLAVIESLQDAARRAFASYSSLVAGEQNGVINRLAIVSVIFLPLSFLTGFFGMNFTFLTDKLETRDEFWLIAVGLQAIVLSGSLYVLHRTRVWRRLRDD